MPQNRHQLQHRLAARTHHIAPFQVMEVQSRARELEAAGRDIIHLEIGEPDFRTPAPIAEACANAVTREAMFYTSALGMTPLREAIANWYETHLGVGVEPERIVVTAGSSAALLLALAATINPGDEVLMGDPCYPCNRHFVRTLEGIPRLLPTGPETGYQPTAAQLAAAWGEQTRGVIAASPANPTGTLVSQREWAALAALCIARGAALIADEIYQGLTYDEPIQTALSVAPDAWVINSFSKYFQMTGWRLGWLVAPAGLTRTVEVLAQNLYISPSTPAQLAALAAFTPATRDIVEARRLELAARRNFLLSALPTLGFQIHAKPQGAFYIYADVSGLTRDAFDYARRVLDHAGVAITPGSDFGVAAPLQHVRIAYTQPIARLQEAVERLAKIGHDF
jgi:aspartate/methionine/tyrosine aminotransferase